MTKPVNLSPSRYVILETIQQNLQQIEQWARPGMEHYANAHKYQSHALALIELLEVNDCGSCGGFDKGWDELKKQGVQPSLYNRFAFLCNKHGWPGHEFMPYQK